MARIQVTGYSSPLGWTEPDPAAAARASCAALEAGNILYFPGIPFDFPRDDLDFLLSQKQSGFRHHKNVSYRPRQDLLRGASSDSPEETEQLHRVLRDYSRNLVAFMRKFLPPYADHWTLDYASFRPLEEQGRDLPLHKRNDLAHVDAFPSRPTHGGRILRVFTNINPTEPRVWEVIGPFEAVARQLAPRSGLEGFARQAGSPLRGARRAVGSLLGAIGIPDRSPYDQFMLRFHDYLKEDSDFQKNWPRERIEFPPMSTWLVYTDMVSHAVMSGQFAVEQTFIVPIEAMVEPQNSPLRVLEAICGQKLGY